MPQASPFSTDQELLLRIAACHQQPSQYGYTPPLSNNLPAPHQPSKSQNGGVKHISEPQSQLPFTVRSRNTKAIFPESKEKRTGQATPQQRAEPNKEEHVWGLVRREEGRKGGREGGRSETSSCHHELSGLRDMRHLNPPFHGRMDDRMFGFEISTAVRAERCGAV